LTAGIEPGGVPPWGGLFALPVYADQHVLDNERIIFNAGDRRVSIAMKSSDFLKITSPHVADITREPGVDQCELPLA
jgi:prolyl-tRNA editing enzyme YbaK/EbsC (Cys-tRNA(Pro) deacylase)